MKKVQLLALLAIFMSHVACGTDTADFEQARTTHTAQAYRDFLQKHPDDKHTQEVQAMLDSFTVARGRALLHSRQVRATL